MFVPSFLDMFPLLFLSHFYFVELAVLNESSPSASALASESYEPLYDCINLYFPTRNFLAFKECISAVEDEKLRIFSESITPVHLETIMELFEVCKDENKKGSDVEAIVKSEDFLEPFKNFVRSNQGGGLFAGSSYIWTTLTSFDQNFENICAKLKILLDNNFDSFLQAGLSAIISPLSFASERGMVECVNLLLKYENVNNLDAAGYTPLLNSFRNENATLINILLQAGADPLFGFNFKSDSLESFTVDSNHIEFMAKPLPCDYPFIKRIIKYKNETIQLLILEGLTPEEKTKMAYIFGFDTALKTLKPDLTDFKWPESLFIEIIEKKYTKLIISLLEDDKLSWTLQTHNLVIMLGIEELFPKLKEEFFKENLEIAAKNGYFSYVAWHLDRKLPIYNSLLKASGANQVKIVELLLIRGGTDISAFDAGLALQEAARNGRTECVALIIEKRTDISADDAGMALRVAAQNGHTECVALTIEKRTDISADDAGMALRVAAQNDHTECVTLIIEKRTDISADDAGFALRCVAFDGHTECVTLTIEKRTDISADDAGFALRCVAKNGHTECVALIIEKRTDISADDAGLALRIAAKNGHTECVTLTIEKRTDISADDAGWALQEAAQNGHVECVALITQYMGLIVNLHC